jgi:hypothetical protein
MIVKNLKGLKEKCQDEFISRKMGTHMDTAPDITLHGMISPKKQQKIP